MRGPEGGGKARRGVAERARLRAISLLARALRKRGHELMLVGNMVLSVGYGIEWETKDIDIFVPGTSPMEERELFQEVCEELGWSFGVTEFGTGIIEFSLEEGSGTIEVLANVFDVYIPEECLERAIRVEVEGTEVKVMRIEDHVIQKARIGRRRDYETLMRIRELADLGVIKLDRKAIYEGLKLFEEGEREKVLRVLERIGILRAGRGRSTGGRYRGKPDFFWYDHDLGRVRPGYRRRSPDRDRDF